MNPRLIWALLRKEIVMELRQRYALNGIVLYVFSTLFIVQLSFKKIDSNLIWLTLFWIVVLFASVNAGAKSFIQEGRQRLLYYYSIARAEDILLAKLIYNCLLLGLLSLLTWLGFSIFFSNMVLNLSFFGWIVALGSMGFAANFTMISAIASKGKSSATLMTVLSFPVIIPQLLLLIRLSHRAVEGESISAGIGDMGGLMAINAVVIVVSYMLFPYLWRD